MRSTATQGSHRWPMSGNSMRRSLAPETIGPRREGRSASPGKHRTLQRTREFDAGTHAGDPPSVGGYHRALERQEALAWMDRLRVTPGGQIEQAFDLFSGGNQQKIVLAKWLRVQPRVFLIDEPTQGVDAGAQTEIY